MQDTWMERLSEYLDEELDRSEREAMETHVRSCAGCSTVLAELRSVRERARAGLEDTPVPPILWSRIEAGITAARVRPAAAAEPQPRRLPRVSRGTRFYFSLPELIAASVAIAILSGGAVFALVKYREGGTPVRQPVMAKAPESAPPARTDAQGPAERAGGGPTPQLAAVPATASPARPDAGTVAAEGESGSPHEVAIAELRKALARQRDRLDPATIRTLESNLAIIDLAIDQGKRALAADPANTYVKEHLADTMRRKVELLQRATMLASTSNSEESR